MSIHTRQHGMGLAHIGRVYRPQRIQHGLGLAHIGARYKPPVLAYRHQRGGGIGAIFGGLLKYLTPYVKSGLRTVGREVLRSGTNVLQDLMDNRRNNNNNQTTFREIVKNRGGESLNTLTEKGLKKLKEIQEQSGKGRRIRLNSLIHKYSLRSKNTPSGAIKRVFSRYSGQSVIKSRATTTGGRVKRKRKRMASVTARKVKQVGGRKRKRRSTSVSRKKRRVSRNKSSSQVQAGGRKKRHRTRRPSKRTRTLDVFDY